MLAYGLKRNWSEYEDYAKNGRRYKAKSHRTQKMRLRQENPSSE